MVTAVGSLGEQLQGFGLSSAAIQAEQVTPVQQSNLFWINTGIGLAALYKIGNTRALLKRGSTPKDRTGTP
jgi:Polysaccharide biosynthesis protein